MANIRCRYCNATFAAGMVQQGFCPGCGKPFEPRTTGVPPVSSRRRAWTFVLAAILVLALVILIIRGIEESSGRNAGLDSTALATRSATQQSRPEEQIAAASNAMSANEPRGVNVNANRALNVAGGPGAAAIEIAPARVVDPQVVSQPAAVAIQAPAVAHPAAQAAAQPADDPLPENRGGRDNDVRELNDPTGTCKVEPLNGNAYVKLTGKIKTLQVASLNGAAVLDASELAAEKIIVTGMINGGTSLHLNAPNGIIHIAGDVNGGAVLTLNAPGGSVVLGSDDQTRIGGGTRLHISARELIVRGTADGGTHIIATLTRDAKLKFTRIEAGAQIAWTKANAGDPDVKIEPGEILGGAACREGPEGDLFVEPPPRPPQMARDSNQPGDAEPRRPVVPADPGPMIPTGLIRTDGTEVAAKIESVDDRQVTFCRPGAALESLPLSKVAVVLFSPVPVSQRAMLSRDGVGLFLRSGDYVEGELKSADHNRVTISSVLFGIKHFDTRKEAAALVLRKMTENK